ncbi:hypothetical protein B8A60_25975 [Pseudomonas aeruginosa]|nr:hypothetical protein B8A60_25975 [Pseudomonas aeruginosa]
MTSALPVVLDEYLLHRGELDGVQSCGLLWLASDWPFHDAVVQVVSRPLDVRRDVRIKSEAGDIVLPAVESQCLEIIEAAGLHVLFQPRPGVTEVRHVPLSGGLHG